MHITYILHTCMVAILRRFTCILPTSCMVIILHRFTCILPTSCIHVWLSFYVILHAYYLHTAYILRRFTCILPTSCIHVWLSFYIFLHTYYLHSAYMNGYLFTSFNMHITYILHLYSTYFTYRVPTWYLHISFNGSISSFSGFIYPLLN